MVIHESRSNATPALQELCKAFRYRRKTVFLVDRDTATLTGGYWTDGSRSQYGLYDLAARQARPLEYPTSPPQFGGAPAPTVTIEPGTFVVRGGVSNGKPAFLWITGPGAQLAFGE